MPAPFKSYHWNSADNYNLFTFKLFSHWKTFTLAFHYWCLHQISNILWTREDGAANIIGLIISQAPLISLSKDWNTCKLYCIPASIATLAQRWPNVNPYVGPTSAHQRWANVDLSIGPTLAQRLHANVGPTLCQHRPNVGTLTLGQRYANGCLPTLYQHWPNGGCVTGFLWVDPIGHRSVTGWTNSRFE